MNLAAVELAWVDEDRYATFTRLALAGAVLAVVFAVVGLPPMGLHSPAHYLGVMGPTCGLTRGTVALVGGSLGDAIRFNPASPLVILGGVALLGRAGVAAVTGRWVDAHVRVGGLGWVLAGVVGAALAVNQQLHADLLRG
ncbi:MAG: DUF2752 domain-containing protein [Acidimicrobiia bacterium]